MAIASHQSAAGNRYLGGRGSFDKGWPRRLFRQVESRLFRHNPTLFFLTFVDLGARLTLRTCL
jgi:hypothetical protein